MNDLDRPFHEDCERAYRKDADTARWADVPQSSEGTLPTEPEVREHVRTMSGICRCHFCTDHAAGTTAASEWVYDGSVQSTVLEAYGYRAEMRRVSDGRVLMVKRPR